MDKTRGRPRLGRCTACGISWEAGDFRKRNREGRSKGAMEAICKPCEAISKRAYKRRLRQEAFDALAGRAGAQCHWPGCDFSDVEGLDIDHVNGGGRAEKRRLGKEKLWRRVVSHPEDYQILCRGHNHVKYVRTGL